MKLLQFEDYQNADSVNVQVSEIGRLFLQQLVESHANFKWTGSGDQIKALAFNDNGFHDDGTMKLELASHETKDGKPYSYEMLYTVHYDCYLGS